MIRFLLLAVTAISLVWLPWQMTVLFMLLVSIQVPLAGIVFGVLLDVLYAPLGVPSLPIGICFGAVASIVGYGISRFLQARIMDA